MKNKHIALAIWALGISGGGTRQFLELALALKRKGYEVDIFTTVVDKEKCYPDLLKHFTIYSLGKNVQQVYPLANFTFIDKFKYLRQHFKNKRANLLRLHQLLKRHDEDKQYIAINYHETEIVKLCQFFPKEKNYWMLNDLYIKGKSIPETLFRYWDNLMFQFLYKPHLQKIIVLDEMNKHLVKKHLHSEAVVLRSGIDQKKFFYKRTYRNPKTFQLLATGIFFPHRRFEDIINALSILVKKKITNIHLNIIGQQSTDQVYADYIDDLIRKNHLEKYVTLLGRVSEKELQNAYRASDIFLFPNNPQTWGLAVFEAMLSGAVAIVSRGAGAHEVLEQHKTGIIVDPENPQAIAKELQYLMKNTQKMKEISLAGQKYVYENLSWNKYAQDMLSLFLDKAA